MKQHSFAMLAALGICASLNGCASPAKPSTMVPQTVHVQKRSAHSVSVVTSGGQATNPLWTSQVSNKGFATALQDAIEKHGVFSRVIRSGDADYKLDVRLVRLQQPAVGFNLRVGSEVAWKLINTHSGQAVWEETIIRPYTASMGEALVAMVRLRKANEGSIRENIKAGLERISTLPL